MSLHRNFYLSIAWTLSLSVVFWVFAASPLCAGEPMPGILTTQLPHIDQTYPTWVSAATATLSDGNLDPGLFHPLLWRQLRTLLQAPVDPELKCRLVGEVLQSWLAPPDTSTLEATFESSRRVLRARVVEHDFGFDRGTPGQLFRVERLETFKGPDDLSTYFFFVPVGRFRVGNEEICKSDHRFPNVPRVGDEVVLLIPEAEEGDPLLDLAFDAGLIILREDESPLAVKRFGSQEALRSRASLLAALAARPLPAPPPGRRRAGGARGGGR